jgi:tRNA(fMet)-specific endonuclease VapC
MKYFLDTNICIYYLKGIKETIKNKLLKKNPDDIKIPSIVKAEMLYGAKKSEKKEENLSKINEFLLPFEIISFSEKETVQYAKIRAELEKKRMPIGPNDIIIASIVMENEGILVTNNIDEFSRIESLGLENWTK